MFSPALEKQRHQLHARAVAGMEKRLPSDPARAADPGQMFDALRWGMDQMEKTYAETPANVLARVACRAGCGHCCHVSVDAQAHEVLYAAEYILRHFSPDDLASVIARAAARRALVAGPARASRDRIMHPCPLLREGSCSIHPDRPEACRAHHASDASACAAHVADPSASPDAVFIPPLRARLFAVMLGIDAAIEQAGFDDRAYDFASALHEALTNSLCRARWLRRQPAFPDSCLA